MDSWSFSEKSPVVSSPANTPNSPAITHPPTTPVLSSTTTPEYVTALRKSSACLHVSFDDCDDCSGSSSDSEGEMEGWGCRLFELEGLLQFFRV